MYTFSSIFTFIFLSHNTPDTLFQFFHPLCTVLCGWLLREILAVSSRAFAILENFRSPSGVSKSLYISSIACAFDLATFLLCLLICWWLPLLLDLFLSSFRILHLIVPPSCLLVPTSSPSYWHTKHLLSSSQNHHAVLLPPFLNTLQ